MLRWLVSALFLALPIGTTIGVLLGIQAVNRANGKPPPFTGGDDTGGLPGIGPIRGKDVVDMRCDIPDGIDSRTKDGLDYTCTSSPDRLLPLSAFARTRMQSNFATSSIRILEYIHSWLDFPMLT